MKIGVDLGGTSVKIGLVNDDGEILCENSFATQASSRKNKVFQDIVAVSLSVSKNIGVSLENIESIGIGSAGCCDVKKGVILKSANVDLHNLDIVAEISKLTSTKVFLENDANCAAWGEYLFGAARGIENSITVTIGTGIGCGLIVGGRIYHGFNFIAGEAGHMCIVVDGEQCSCGRKGCFEKYASATALVSLTCDMIMKYHDSVIWSMVEGSLKNVTAETAFVAARMGDEAGKLVVNKFIKYLGEGILNLISILQPEKLVIGGGLSNEGDDLLKPLKKFLKARGAYTMGIQPTEVVISKLRNDAGIIGAAMLGT